MPANTSKGMAAKALRGILGIDQIVAFGDAKNDRELFREADECYAVKNADEALKEISTDVIGYSEEDAVAKFIRENLSRYAG